MTFCGTGSQILNHQHNLLSGPLSVISPWGQDIRIVCYIRKCEGVLTPLGPNACRKFFPAETQTLRARRSLSRDAPPPPPNPFPQQAYPALLRCSSTVRENSPLLSFKPVPFSFVFCGDESICFGVSLYYLQASDYWSVTSLSCSIPNRRGRSVFMGIFLKAEASGSEWLEVPQFPLGGKQSKLH